MIREGGVLWECREKVEGRRGWRGKRGRSGRKEKGLGGKIRLGKFKVSPANSGGKQDIFRKYTVQHKIALKIRAAIRAHRRIRKKWENSDKN